MIDWDEYRREDYSIDLVKIWVDEHDDLEVGEDEESISFLRKVENLQKLKSRQVASLALATAEMLIKKEKE